MKADEDEKAEGQTVSAEAPLMVMYKSLLAS